jgi:hypothetical protein
MKHAAKILATLAAFCAVSLPSRAADEVNAAVTLQVTKGYLSQSKITQGTFSLTATSPNAVGGTQLIGTNAAEAITIGDVVETSKGWAYFRNTESTNITAPVAIGVVSGSDFIEFARLNPREFGAIPLGTNIIYAQAIGTNSVVLEKLIVDR